MALCNDFAQLHLHLQKAAGEPFSENSAQLSKKFALSSHLAASLEQQTSEIAVDATDSGTGTWNRLKQIARDEAALESAAQDLLSTVYKHKHNIL